MIGAVIGDVIGSVYEFDNVKTKEFELFQKDSIYTDDSVLTFAIAKSILDEESYIDNVKDFGRRYSDAGYGGMFKQWLFSEDVEPYNSYGNGSAMRVSSVGFLFDTIEDVLYQAELSAAITHNHQEGIKGAQATALSIFLARTGNSKEQIKHEIETRFGYDLNRTLDEIRPTYKFNETCQKTVPESIISFLESTDFEDAIRNAISLGGDSDTLACICGGIAEAFYGEIPDYILSETLIRLPQEFIDILNLFDDKVYKYNKSNKESQ
jgi:ADP-ribosylglycohydrolase